MRHSHRNLYKFSNIICPCQSAKENFDLVKEQWVTEAVRLRTDVDKCVKPTDFMVESEKKVKEEGDAAMALMKTSPVSWNTWSVFEPTMSVLLLYGLICNRLNQQNCYGPVHV